mmetsp:Transcript_530/g.1922  ORF Transcript_530/g.1922 Transcript_530/m.1922 type:complete len:252 (+) Transcript_530:813-1568(+)
MLQRRNLAGCAARGRGPADPSRGQRARLSGDDQPCHLGRPGQQVPPGPQLLPPGRHRGCPPCPSKRVCRNAVKLHGHRRSSAAQPERAAVLADATPGGDPRQCRCALRDALGGPEPLGRARAGERLEQPCSLASRAVPQGELHFGALEGNGLRAEFAQCALCGESEGHARGLDGRRCAGVLLEDGVSAASVARLECRRDGHARPGGDDLLDVCHVLLRHRASEVLVSVARAPGEVGARLRQEGRRHSRECR